MELTAYEWIGVKCDWELVIDRLMNNVGDKKKSFGTPLLVYLEVETNPSLISERKMSKRRSK